MAQQFCLKWNNHMNNMMDVFKNLLSTESMVDVTLACDGLSLKAHKIVLSACSPFFQSLFLENPCKHPIVILKDMKYSELKAIIEFMYHGEVNVAQDQLSALMKTAETLRVKGLAEMPNEKSSSNASQEEPGHRSVPRTETPPPSSKRRRGRVRKRSLSDSNRSDDSNETKIKQPPSPDIEELSGDVTMDTSGQFSNLQSQVPMQSLPSHSTNSYQKTSSVVSQDPQIEEPASADESEFGVEPAKLLEQTLTTDDLSNARRSGRSSVSGMEMQRRPRSSTDHSSNLVPTSMPSEALGSNQQPESPPDIKPELLELDPPMSPVAGPSHSTDNSMMMYMDQSSVSSHPGTSYQDNTALVPQDSQPQASIWKLRSSDLGKQRTRFKCSQCNYWTSRLDAARKHLATHFAGRSFKCCVCLRRYTAKKNCRRHMKKHNVVMLDSCKESPKYDENGDTIVYPSAVRTRLKPFKCEICELEFQFRSNCTRHQRLMHGIIKKNLNNKEYINVKTSADIKIGTHSSEDSNIKNMTNIKEDTSVKKMTVMEDGMDVKKMTDNKEVTGIERVTGIEKDTSIRSVIIQEHNPVHTGVKPYKCDICERRFRFKSNCRRHQRQVHKKMKYSYNKEFITADIPSDIKVASNVKQDSNIKKVTNVKNIVVKCGQCGYSANFTDVAEHMQTHITDKPLFKCSICAETFEDMSYFKEHVETHALVKKTSGVKEAADVKDVSNLMFKYDKRHAKCSHCEYSTDSGDVKKHMCFHTVERDYSCKICEKMFSTLSNYNKHLKTHDPVEENQEMDTSVKNTTDFDASYSDKSAKLKDSAKEEEPTRVPDSTDQTEIKSAKKIINFLSSFCDEL